LKLCDVWVCLRGMPTRGESGVHKVGTRRVEAGVCPLTEGAGDLLLLELVADA